MGDFSKYSIITTVSGKIRAMSPIRIGAGRDYSVIKSDLPVIKDTNENPVIPGSSLKGFFRGHLSKLLLTKMKEDEAEKLIIEIFGGTEENESASAIFFHEIPIKIGRITERKHIAINPETGGVRNLFEVECVLDGAVFEGRLFSGRNLHPKAFALIKPIIDLTNLGVARIGGFKSRGYGEIAIDIDEIRMIFPGKSIEDLNKGFEVDNLIPERFGSVKVKKSDEGVYIENNVFKAELKENIAFLGIEICFRDSEASRFLESMVKVVRL